MKLRNPFSGWEALDPQQRTRILKISGLVVGAFALFTLISILSYLFVLFQQVTSFSDCIRARRSYFLTRNACPCIIILPLKRCPSQ